MRTKTVLMAALLTAVTVRGAGPSSQQNRDAPVRGSDTAASGGSIAGIARDTTGAPVPGVTIAAVQGAHSRTAVTDAAGRYEVDGLVAGAYRVRADLPGFRRSICESVVVIHGARAECNPSMRVGIFTTRPLVVWPEGAVPPTPIEAADAIIHLHVVQAVGPAVLGASLATEHIAVAGSVLKGTVEGPIEGSTFRFWQLYAGEWIEDDRRIVGDYPLYRPGDEFIGVFALDDEGRLHEFAGGLYMFRVVDGRVTVPWPGIPGNASVGDVVAAFRNLPRGVR